MKKSHILSLSEQLVFCNVYARCWISFRCVSTPSWFCTTSRCLSQTAYPAAPITAGGLIEEQSERCARRLCTSESQSAPSKRPYKTPSLSQAYLLIVFFFLMHTFASCAQEVLWVNFLIAYACGLVVGKLTSSVVGGRDAGVAPDCWREGERLRQT